MPALRQLLAMRVRDRKDKIEEGLRVIDAHGSPTSSGSGSSITADYVGRETAGLLWFWLAERRRVDQVVAT